MRRLRGATGQASVEFLALLPILGLLVLAAWQGVLVGRAAWSSAGAARAAARAQAIGGDVGQAARDALPRALRRGLRVRRERDGVRVGVRVPLLLTRFELARIDARAALPSQR